MVDFRRYLTGLAVFAVMAGAASAQVGVISGSAGAALSCSASAAAIPELRPEGYTELVGDIVITCTGGPTSIPGTPIPTTNITVSLSPAVPITSRLLGGAAGSSEVLLIIDEAGANVATGVVNAFGPRAPQVPCTTAQQQALGGSACTAIVGADPAAPTYAVALTTAGGPNAANVYQGRINSDFANNSVTFFAVPVLPPATAGVSRVFRITNIRIPVPNSGLPNVLASPVTALITSSPSTIMPISQPQVLVGVVGRPLTASVGGVTTFQQCIPQVRALASTITFTEGFATAFKTRVVPGGAANLGTNGGNPNFIWAGQQQNLASPFNQNIPGGLYGGLAANSESGFIFPALNNGSGFTAGLADFGTRLKAVFYNIPVGQTLFVSNTSINGTIPSPLGGTSMFPYAVLIATNTVNNEGISDGTAFSGSNIVGGNTITQIALTPNASGVASAVWEVINANPSAQDVLQFGVYTSYTAASPTATFIYGTPITDLPLGAPLNDVQLSFAPEPGGGLFTTANATTTATLIPRFASIATYEGRFLRINLCQTTLLYPYITGASGFDSGIAVANTSTDPFGTVHQTGSCTLYGYGVTVGAAANTPVATVIPGCDSLANPLEGTNCFGVVPSGQVKSLLATSSSLANFSGYVIAVCNFQYAHGYAAITDLGLRNLWSSYLALELNPLPTSGSVLGLVGSPRLGVFSIETLAH